MAARSAARHRLDRAEPVDEQAVAGVGGHPARRWCAGPRSGPPPRARPCRCGPWRPRRRAGAARAAPWSPPARRSGRSPARWRAARRAGVPRSSARLSRRPGVVGRRLPRTPAAGTPVCRVPSLRLSPVCADSHGRRALRGRGAAAAYPASVTDRYGSDVLSGDWRAPRGGRSREVEAETGLVVEDVETGWCGAVVRVEKAGGMQVVHLEDRRGRTKGFPLGPGLPARRRPGRAHPAHRRRPGRSSPTARAAASRTASGSRAVEGATRPGGQRVADLRRGPPRRRAGREGLGRRPAGRGRGRRDARRRRRPRRRRSATSSPGPARRMGVLVDHLVPGTKESRVVDRPRARRPYAAHVRVLGHPYVDVWQSVRPERLGLQAWPVIPRGQSWKHGICAAPRLAAPTPGRHRPGVEADPRHRAHLRRPRADPAGQRRGAHRLRDRARRTDASARLGAVGAVGVGPLSSP